MTRLLLALLCCLAPIAALSESPRPNLLFILVDDLGYGDTGFTGHPFIETPRLDALAKSGATFSQFYAPASVCSPSRASMMTGRMSYRLGIYSFLHVGAKYQHLRPSEVTYAQLLRKAGYQTALVGKWHLCHNDFRDEFPQPDMDHYGFDYYFSSDNNTVIKDKPKWWENDENRGKPVGYAANVVGAQVVKWLDERRDAERPFLLCVNFYEPHWRVAAPERYRKKYEDQYPDPERPHYPACIENVDTEVGRILDKVEELGLEENTIVFFTSDHGPAKYGKGRAYDRNDGRSTPYRGYKYGLWDGSVHVPGVIRWPGVTTPGQVVEPPCGAIDYLPTVCAMAGVPVPEDRPIDGVDISPLLRGQKLPARGTALQWHYYNATVRDKTSPQAVIRRGDFVLVGFYDEVPKYKGRWYPEHDDFMRNKKLVRFELFNIRDDPEQRRNISAEFPKQFAALKEELMSSHAMLQKGLDDWKEESRAQPR